MVPRGDFRAFLFGSLGHFCPFDPRVSEFVAIRGNRGDRASAGRREPATGGAAARDREPPEAARRGHAIPRQAGAEAQRLRHGQHRPAAGEGRRVALRHAGIVVDQPPRASTFPLAGRGRWAVVLDAAVLEARPEVRIRLAQVREDFRQGARHVPAGRGAVRKRGGEPARWHHGMDALRRAGPLARPRALVRLSTVGVDAQLANHPAR